MTEYTFYIQENKDIREKFYQRYGNHFSKDGVYSPKDMFDCEDRPHIVYLLKEAIDNPEDWEPCRDLENIFRAYPESGNGSNVYGGNLCRPVKYLTDGIWWDYVKRDSPEEFSVKGFAYINVKKKAEGKGRSKNWDLDNYARSDAELLKRQIVSCRPDIVFCCQNNDCQVSRLETILGKPRQVLDKSIDFAWLFDYEYQEKSNQLIAIRWIHLCQGSISNKALHARLDMVRPYLKSICQKNSR